MSAYFLTFTYPDGHAEEIEEVFPTLKDAVSYGDSLLNQVRVTESMKKAGRNSGDAEEPSYIVKEVKDGKRSIVYRSE
ncbi:MAG: hypothetical protein K5694_06730 [Bacilli bacterium]|nr:hypothetical protein [Bacilli bacterium]